MRIKLTAVVVLFMVLAPLDAQQRRQGRGRAANRPPSRHSRNHDTVKKAFVDVVAAARRSTVRVLGGRKQVALGAIVDADGHIVTKASELPDGEITCQLPDGRKLPARITGVHDKNDLAMLAVDAKDLTPLAWSEGTGCKPGSWLATPGPGDVPISIGVMSAQVHARPDRRDPNRGYLGVQTEQWRDAVRLRQVMPGTAAEAAGLRRRDVILEFGDREVRSRQQFSSSIGRRKPGDKIKLKVRRRGEELIIEATLRKNDDRRGPISNQEQLWGQLSDVRIGFTAVIQHDSILKPNQCGGPLVNLDGEVVGINISRVGRIETLALTGKAVRKMLADLKSGKLAPKSSAAVEGDPKKRGSKKN
ncbi:MAG: S1C family serine protease [Planctomycetota bacterium]|jgi:serine protease Do